MRDFFDEDFPLSKKQEEELNKLAQTPKTLEEPPVLEEDDNQNVPAYSPEDDKFSYIPVDEDEPIDPMFSYTPVEEEYYEEDKAEEAAVPDDVPPVEEVTAEEKAKPEAVDLFDEEFEEESKPEPEAVTVSHASLADEYLAKLRQMTDIEEQLQQEIKSLGEQVDEVEMKVDNLPDEAVIEAEAVAEAVADETEADDDTEQTGFDYEYDERYFAEEETPAYKHPELYKKPAKTVRRPAKRKATSKNGEITVNVKTLLGVGAAVAAAIAAAKLLGDDKK